MLALVGSGEYLSEVDVIDRELISRLDEPPRVVCLPTAAGREGNAMIQSWMDRGEQHFRRLGAEVSALRVFDRETANDEANATAIRQANFVYMSGGHPGYLAECYEGSAVWDAILSVHQSGGVVAGCSAGAMIMGERIAGPGGNREGFKLLPNTVIMPHFDEFPGMLSRIMRAFSDRSLTMIGIDGRTAFVVNDSQYEVLGRGNVTMFSKQGRTVFGAGAIPVDMIPNK